MGPETPTDLRRPADYRLGANLTGTDVFLVILTVGTAWLEAVLAQYTVGGTIFMGVIFGGPLLVCILFRVGDERDRFADARRRLSAYDPAPLAEHQRRRADQLPYLAAELEATEGELERLELQVAEHDRRQAAAS